MVVDTAALNLAAKMPVSLQDLAPVSLNLVIKMPDNYAAMSYFEFFAENYALYYDYDDPNRKALPKLGAKWIDENIGKRAPENPRRTAARCEPD